MKTGLSDTAEPSSSPENFDAGDGLPLRSTQLRQRVLKYLTGLFTPSLLPWASIESTV
jgi:hypothetical protein